MTSVGSIQVYNAPCWDRRWGAGVTKRCGKDEMILRERQLEKVKTTKYPDMVETGEEVGAI